MASSSAPDILKGYKSRYPNLYVANMVVPQESKVHLVVSDIPIYYDKEMFLLLASCKCTVEIKSIYFSGRGDGIIEYANAEDTERMFKVLSNYRPNHDAAAPLNVSYAKSPKLRQATFAINGLPPDADEKFLEELCSRYGKIESVYISSELSINGCRFARIRFVDPLHVWEAVHALNGATITSMDDPGLKFKINCRIED